MLKDYYNEIIPPWDSRYGKIGHLWKSYNWNNLVDKEDDKAVYYFIPPELVITEMIFRRGWKLLKKLDKDDDWCNWFSSKTISSKLKYCNLSTRDYFNLLILKKNDRNYAYRCDNCKSSLTFSNRIYYGYNQTYAWIDVDHAFCCKSCSAYFQSMNLDLFPSSRLTRTNWINARYETKNKIKTDYFSWLSRGSELDESYLYISKVNSNKLKFGVTTDPDSRSIMFNQVLSNLHVLIKSTRLEVGNIESRLKLEFSGSEYIEYKDLSKFFKLLKSILITRPVISLFN